MPARLSSMELSSPSNPDVDTSAQPSRRKSGRVSKQPQHLSPSSAPGSGKRKRVDQDADDSNDEHESDSAEVDSEDDEPAEEEIREKKRKAKTANKRDAAGSTKRAKPNGVSNSLAFRPAGAKVKRLPKGRLVNDVAAENVGGLYGDVFGSDDRLDDVAAQWLARFKEHEANALTEFINFVLRCAGCNIAVHVHDIEDPDNCTSKLAEIQDEFQAQKLVEYPLIAKRTATAFKKSLTIFINALVKSIAASNLLFDQPDLMDNVQVWVSSMSSSVNRPFRHTSTMISLEIISTLCTLGRGILDNRATVLRQKEGEQKKKKTNQGRIEDLQAKADLAASQTTQVDNIIKDWFDTVFVHRYRDVDPKIRLDCMIYLSEWIQLYPEQFFEGQYLRYLGWELSDLSAPARHEVVKQLLKIYKDEDKVPGLRQFTERFRPRLVEIAARDSEPNIRASAVELLDVLRESGLLEPDDIDSVGKLIFDTEPRVRKAVVSFFIASIEETYESKLEELGGEEAIKESLPAVDTDDFESPRLEWLRFKCLAELLCSYDTNLDGNLHKSIERRVGESNDVLFAAGTESRFSLAAQVLFDKLTDGDRWEILAGLLLFDHSSQRESSASDDVLEKLKEESKLAEVEEVVLLDVLNVSVKSYLTELVESTGPKKVKKTKAQLQAIREKQDEAAQRLAILIPKLLKKFGSAPEATAAVLRLEQVLNLDVFQELRQESTTYAAFLEDINRQFLTHEDQDVLSSARAALLYAKTFEELQEVTDGKLQMLWDDTTFNFNQLCSGEEISSRGAIKESALRSISSSTLRMANLASISSCTAALDKPIKLPPVKSRRQKQPTLTPTGPLTHLLSMVTRGLPVSDISEEVNQIEDSVFQNVCRLLLFYFMWSAQSLMSGRNPSAFTDAATLLEHRDTCLASLRYVLSHRKGADSIRITAAGTLLDIETIFKQLEESSEQFNAVKAGLRESDQKHLLSVLSGVEKAFANKSGKVLESAVEVEDDAEPVSDEEEDEDNVDVDADPESEDEEIDEDDEDAVERRRIEKANTKHRAALLAEERLCSYASKLVLAVVAGLLDHADSYERHVAEKAFRKRLERNQGKLGQNFKMVVAQLDPAKQTTNGPAARKSKATAGKGKTVAKSREGITSEDASDRDGDTPMPEAEDEDDGLQRQGDGVEDDANGDEERAATESILGD